MAGRRHLRTQQGLDWTEDYILVEVRRHEPMWPLNDNTPCTSPAMPASTFRRAEVQNLDPTVNLCRSVLELDREVACEVRPFRKIAAG